MTQDVVNERKKEKRRLIAGDVLGLHVPATTPNLSTVKAISVTEAAAATLDFYNAGDHVGGEGTTVLKRRTMSE